MTFSGSLESLVQIPGTIFTQPFGLHFALLSKKASTDPPDDMTMTFAKYEVQFWDPQIDPYVQGMAKDWAPGCENSSP